MSDTFGNKHSFPPFVQNGILITPLRGLCSVLTYSSGFTRRLQLSRLQRSKISHKSMVGKPIPHFRFII
jgi:hypothetical protein